MRRNFFGLIVPVLLFTLTQPSQAQFEGTFSVETYGYSDGQAVPQKTVHVAMTPERIMITGLEGTEMPSRLGGMKSNAVLVRLDKKDFIILGDNKQALQVQKSELENMVNMAATLSGAMNDGARSTTDKPKTIMTNKKRKIEGYDCRMIKILKKDKDGDQLETDIWVTKQIPVQWGMLAEPWEITDPELSGLFPPEWLKNGTMPLSMQLYQNGVERYSMKLTHLSKKKISSDQISIPTGYRIVSFRQMLMNRMFGNQ